MSRPLDHLRSLHRLMQEHLRVTELLAGVPEEMRSLDAEYGGAKREIAGFESDLDAARKDRRKEEAEVADAQEKLKHFQQQISRVRNQREYGALLAEIDGAKNDLRQREEKALGAMERIEQLEKQLAERLEGFGDLEGRYNAELAKWEKEKPAVAARARDLEKELAEERKHLQRPVVSGFERVFERYRGEAMAPLRRAQRLVSGPSLWHCGACNYHVRPQVAVEIRSAGAIVQCEACKRFLFAEDES